MHIHVHGLVSSCAVSCAHIHKVSCEVQDSENDAWQQQGPVQSGVPRHWGSVRCGCIEGVLATAILAGQHPDVWDAAGLLLREHNKYNAMKPPLPPPPPRRASLQLLASLFSAKAGVSTATAQLRCVTPWR